MAKAPKPAQLNVGFATERAPGTPDEAIIWEPQPGPQTMAVMRDEFEIFYGGAKGGGKSFSIIGFLMKGNPEVPLSKATPIDLTYLNCPTYRAVVIRKNLEDLNSWIAEAFGVYRKLGAAYTQKPNEFTFPSGAKIIMGHLDDDKAVEKYFGNVVHRAAIDELTFIAERKNYMKLVSCVRANVKGIRPQVFSTGNPGGPGTAWVMERFVEPKDAQGITIPPLTQIVEEYWNPHTQKMECKTRVFIPSKLKDNPKLLATDPGYYGTLAIMPEAERKAFLEGDWHALGGLFFSDFRAKHLEGEQPEACHVITRESRTIPRWYPRVASLDWGFGHEGAFLGAIKTPQKQIIFDKEIVRKEIGSIEWGYLIAKALVDDLNGLKSAGVSPVITLWVGHDAYGKRDEHKTQVEGIAEGIGRVLGPNAVHIPELFGKPSIVGDETFFEQADFQAKAGIVIRRAQNARIAGANHCREMLRWRQVAALPQEKFDPVVASRLRMEDDKKFDEYVAAFKRREPEILPKMLIFDNCIHLIQSIPSLVHDDDNREDVLKTDAISDQLYDACFVAGTTIKTNRGDVPIEAVKVGDQVLTRNGFQPILDAGLTRHDAPLLQLQLSNGKTLVATGNHPIFVKGKGFCRLDELRYGDTLLPWQRSKLSSFKACVLRDIQSLRTTLCDGISMPLGQCVSSIERFGNRFTGIFRKGEKFTTGTRITSTTTSQIWNALRVRSIALSTLLTEALSDWKSCVMWPIGFGHLLANGMVVRSASSGTRNTESVFGRVASWPLESASIATQNTRRSSRGLDPNFVETTASRRLDVQPKVTWWSGLVNFVVQVSSAINTQIFEHAPVHVVRLSNGGTGDVYNLTVANHPEYFANGILVHNCRYLLHSESTAQNREPKQSFVQRHMDRFSTGPLSFDDKVWMARAASEEYAKSDEDMRPFSIHAASRFQ